MKLTYRRLRPRAEFEEQPIPAVVSYPVQSNIARIDNHVYFYADVTPESCLRLMQELRNAAANLRAAGFCSIPIELHIMSDGGDLFPAFAIVDQIKGLGMIQVKAVIEGLCASAATLIAMACDVCYIRPHAFMLVHPMSGGFEGQHEQIQDYAGMLRTLNEKLIGFYLRNSNIPDRGRVEDLMRRESWLDAQQAVDLGMVDGII